MLWVLAAQSGPRIAATAADAVAGAADAADAVAVVGMGGSAVRYQAAPIVHQVWHAVFPQGVVVCQVTGVVDQVDTTGCVPPGLVAAWPARLELRSSAGDGSDGQVVWRVVVDRPAAGTVRRSVWYQPVPSADAPADARRGQVPWKGDETWQPELDIWPVWRGQPDSPNESASGPLETVHQHCRRNGDRLRESAKWMATVVGLALAALVGTSPLSQMRSAGPSWWTITLGAAGLTLLAVALFLILRVIRPHPVSYREVQAARRGPLQAWRQMIEAEQDLYLPCGIKCLTTLRQTLIVDELTLNVLARAVHHPDTATEDSTLLKHALSARAARLRELRHTASDVVAIADYYQLQRKSTVATYLGGMCAVLATAAIVTAFILPT